jgi:hypothetical protein
MATSNSGDAALQLADRYLPVFQFSEQHGIASVKASAASILHAARSFDDRRDRVVNFLQALREVPARLIARAGSANALANRPRFGLADFFLLEETGNELALGLIGRFWKLDYGLVRITDARAFQDFSAPGYGKLVMVWSVLPGADGQRLLTETRIYCPDRHSRILFSFYWVAIRIASGWIRLRILRQLKADAERHCGGRN